MGPMQGDETFQGLLGAAPESRQSVQDGRQFLTILRVSRRRDVRRFNHGRQSAAPVMSGVHGHPRPAARATCHTQLHTATP